MSTESRLPRAKSSGALRLPSTTLTSPPQSLLRKPSTVGLGRPTRPPINAGHIKSRVAVTAPAHHVLSTGVFQPLSPMIPTPTRPSSKTVVSKQRPLNHARSMILPRKQPERILGSSKRLQTTNESPAHVSRPAAPAKSSFRVGPSSCTMSDAERKLVRPHAKILNTLGGSTRLCAPSSSAPLCRSLRTIKLSPPDCAFDSPTPRPGAASSLASSRHLELRSSTNRLSSPIRHSNTKVPSTPAISTLLAKDKRRTAARIASIPEADISLASSASFSPLTPPLLVGNNRIGHDRGSITLNDVQTGPLECEEATQADLVDSEMITAAHKIELNLVQTQRRGLESRVASLLVEEHKLLARLELSERDRNRAITEAKEVRSERDALVWDQVIGSAEEAIEEEIALKEMIRTMREMILAVYAC